MAAPERDPLGRPGVDSGALLLRVRAGATLPGQRVVSIAPVDPADIERMPPTVREAAGFVVSGSPG